MANHQTHLPVFDVRTSGYDPGELWSDGLPTPDIDEATKHFNWALNQSFNEDGEVSTREVELLVSFRRDEWQVLRRAVSVNADWLWFIWEGGRAVAIYNDEYDHFPVDREAMIFGMGFMRRFGPPLAVAALDHDVVDVADLISQCEALERTLPDLVTAVWGPEDDRYRRTRLAPDRTALPEIIEALGTPVDELDSLPWETSSSRSSLSDAEGPSAPGRVRVARMVATRAMWGSQVSQPGDPP